MSITQALNEQHTSDAPRCPRCHSVLPVHAAFCGVCGERIQQVQHAEHNTYLTATVDTIDNTDNKDNTSNTGAISSSQYAPIAERYRFTTLVRRSPYVQLFLAIDKHNQRPVAIRDIDITSLSDEQRTHAIDVAQEEYDLLRRRRIHDVMPVIDLRYHNGHIYVISSWSLAQQQTEQDPQKLHLQTLQDLLQSGVGLPQESVALTWTYRLCRALERLHAQKIVPGDIDSSTIIVSQAGYDGSVALMVSWLPTTIRDLLPPTSGAITINHFSAPEVQITGISEPRSDLYSLGAILYLLLTGVAPDDPAQRIQRSLRTPRDINPRISTSTSTLVMHALALEPAERYTNAGDMAKVLLQTYSQRQGRSGQTIHEDDAAAIGEEGPPEQPTDDPEDVTISIVPIQAQLARWHLSRMRASGQSTQESREQGQAAYGAQQPASSRPNEASLGSNAFPYSSRSMNTDLPLPEPMPRISSTWQPSGSSATTKGAVQPLRDTRPSPIQRFKAQLSGMLLALPRVKTTQPNNLVRPQPVKDTDTSFLKQLQRFFLGEQQHSTTAAALIETPLRVQPGQSYTLRIHLMGRDIPNTPLGARRGTAPTGLSALIQGETVHIEVRSALYQNYAYIIQRADVTLPGQGYAAEVVIPMQPLESAPSGRRERLHIFFTDELRHPLYEKPFVVEVFVSHLVQSGREGYNVIPIPL